MTNSTQEIREYIHSFAGCAPKTKVLTKKQINDRLKKELGVK